MKQISFLILAVWLFSPAAAVAGADALSPDAPSTLNERVTVAGDVVVLGDVFTNAGKKSGQAIAYSPKAGKKAVFDAPWLGRVAEAFNLNWKPVSGTEQVVVERSSQTIESGEIKSLLVERLIEEGVDGSFDVVLANNSIAIHAPGNDDGEIVVDDIAYDPIDRNFNATVSWLGDDTSRQVRVKGRVESVTEIPVLARRIMRGENISMRDIRWLSVRSSRLQRDVVVDHADLIGMTAKRTIAANLPVRVSEISRPLMVEKGSNVTIRLDTPLMQLSTKGRALENGSRGDVIRVSNLQTNTVIEAEITGPGTARVSSSVSLAMK